MITYCFAQQKTIDSLRQQAQTSDAAMRDEHPEEIFDADPDDQNSKHKLLYIAVCFLGAKTTTHP